MDGLTKSEAMKVQLVRDLYDRSRLAITSMLVMVTVIGWAVMPALKVDPHVRLAFGLLIAINLLRFLLSTAARTRREALPIGTQFGLFLSGVALASLSLAALVVLSWPLLDPARVAIVAVLTSGIVSGAVMSMGFSPLTYMVYMLPPVSALFVMCLTDTRPHWGADIMATSFVIYAAAVLAVSLDQRRNWRNAIELQLQLSDMVVRDSLTRLHNRRFLQEFMALESERLARDRVDLEHGRQPLRDVAIGIFMMDLDLFKQVNDIHGHAAGDLVLKRTGQVLAGALRKSDNLVRWGGEEFVAIARVKDISHVRIVAEKLRIAIEQTLFDLPDGQSLRKTISIGFAAMPFEPAAGGHLGWEQVLSLADAALYVAKAEGRNRWVGVVPGLVAWGDDSDKICAGLAHDLQHGSDAGLVVMHRHCAAHAPPGG